MQNATLATLPPEVLDLIFGFVEEEDPSLLPEDNASSRLKTYVALSHTSKALLPACRNRLYADPLSGGSRSWKKAVKLLVALQSNDQALGRLVRSLRALPDWLDVLSSATTDVDTRFFQLVGQNKAFSWMIAMVTACTRLQETSIAFKTLPQTTLLASALKPSLLTLQVLVLQRAQHFETPMGLVNRFLSKFEIMQLRHLECRGLGRWSKKENGKYQKEYTAPHTVFPVLNFSIHMPPSPAWPYSGYEGYPRSYIQFLPDDLSRLAALTIECNVIDAYRLGNILPLTSGRLTHLTIRHGVKRWSGSFLDYAVSSIWNGRTYFIEGTLKVEDFGLFPRLEYLELQNVRTLSVARLEALSRAFPSLVSLLCPGCLWLADGAEPSRATPGWNTTLFPPARLAEVFKSFPQLKKVDLGVVPFKDEADFAQLVYSLEEDKVDVKYELCSAP